MRLKAWRMEVKAGSARGPLRHRGLHAALALARGSFVAWLGATCLFPSLALSEVTVCARFQGPKGVDVREHQRLLEDEVRHRRRHVVVRAGCRVHLVLDYIRLSSGGILTGRAGNGVPHRIPVKSEKELAAKIRQVVTLVLKTEPISLVENLETSGLLKPRPQSLLRHGVNFYGVEMLSSWVRTETTIAALPGAAFRFRRTVDRWFAGARVSFAMDPQTLPLLPSEHVVRFLGTAAVEVGINFFRDSFATLYVSGLVGVEYLQVYGTIHGGTSGLKRSSITAALGIASLRIGVELLRTMAIRADIFVMVDLPFHKTHNVDSPVIDDYTPSWGVGCGVAF